MFKNLFTRKPAVPDDIEVAEIVLSVDEQAMRDSVKTLLCKSMVITGNIEQSDGIDIDGVVNGDVHIHGDSQYLILNEGAEITGNVRVANAVIKGHIAGSLTADNVFLEETAVIDGELNYRQMTMAGGATLNGRSTRIKAEVKALPEVVLTDEIGFGNESAAG